MIACAATRYLIDGLYIVTLPVHRHKDADLIMRLLMFEDDSHEWIKVKEGFLTDTGDFLDREIATEHAYECGQLDWLGEEDKESVMISECLMSEDLW